MVRSFQGFGSGVWVFEPYLRKPSVSSQAKYASTDLRTLMALPSPASLCSGSAPAFVDDVSCHLPGKPPGFPSRHMPTTM